MLSLLQLESHLEKLVKQCQDRGREPLSEVVSVLNENLRDYVNDNDRPVDVVAVLMSELNNQGILDELRERLEDPETKEYDLWGLLSEYHTSSLY